MKLINKFTLWYLVITFLVLGAGGIIVFYNVRFEIGKSERHRLESIIAQTEKQIRKGTSIASLRTDRLSIEEISFSSDVIKFNSKNTLLWFSQDQGMEEALEASASFRITGKHYLITVHQFLPEFDEIFEGIVHSLIWIFALLLFLTLLASRLISLNLLAPFNHTIHVIQSFNLKQKNKMSLSDTTTQEFRQLNQFLEKMTGKALNDYRALKEFTENASHELQTPLAIIRGKMELLTESPLNDEQAKHIISALDAIEKLSKINQSLLLLSKLENQEYDTTQPVDFSKIITNSIEIFRELIELKSIVLLTEIERDFTLQLNPVLGEILFNNLLSNAIRHNNEQGSILVMLKRSSLKISNTGGPPDGEPAQMFGRFRKSNQSNESIGLGLSIVKQICELHHFTVDYKYDEDSHTVEVTF